MGNITYIGGLFSNTFHIQPHRHRTYELVYYTQGCGHVDIGDQTEAFSAGCVTIIAPGVIHTDYADGGFQNLHMNLQHPGIHVDGYLKLQDSESRDIHTILSLMYNEYHLKRSNWIALIDRLYAVLFEYMVTLMDTPPNSLYVDRTIHDIIANISNPAYTLGQSLEAVPFNPNYFRELFVREVGLTPAQFLLSKRMNHARMLLETRHLTGFSLNEIAFNCGYADYYYFSRVFKKATGHSPRSWTREDLDPQAGVSSGDFKESDD